MTNTNATDTIKLGIVGLGNMGAGHAKAFLGGHLPGATLAAVCDADPSRLQAYDGVSHWDDAETMFAEAGLDAVLIATPHFDHVRVGISALNAGLHVLVEKPIAVHKADAERLLAAHTNPRQVFAAMFNQRTDPHYCWLKERIADGSLGRIQRVTWIITNWFRTEAYYRSGGWRATWAGEGGGVLLNQCPHQLDLWQWLFGMPQRVHAFCGFGRFHDIEVEDDVTAFLEYGDGPRGTFITTTGEAPGTNRLEIAAENGKVVIDGNEIVFFRNEVPSSEFSRTSDKPFGPPPCVRETHAIEGHGEQHRGILKNFIDAIRNDAPLLAPASEGIRSVELSNAMLYAGLTGQAVDLPLDGRTYEAKLQELIRTSRFTKK